jgi:hypothetical protein
MTITLEQARLLSVAEITGLSAQDLMQLQSAVDESLRQARDLKEWIDGAIALKYDGQAEALRAKLGKDTGTVHFDESIGTIKTIPLANQYRKQGAGNTLNILLPAQSLAQLPRIPTKSDLTHCLPGLLT